MHHPGGGGKDTPKPLSSHTVENSPLMRDDSYVETSQDSVHSPNTVSMELGKLGKAIDALHNHLAGLRTGRASTGLIERLMVEYYGADTPLQQLANLAAPEARMLTVTPYDKSAMKAIEKAIRSSDLGLNPNSDGNVIRINIPPLTEARRREMVKIAQRTVEESRIAIRNIRREAMSLLKELDESGDISEDERRRGEERVQKLTDRAVESADRVGREKEAEVLAV